MIVFIKLEPDKNKACWPKQSKLHFLYANHGHITEPFNLLSSSCLIRADKSVVVALTGRENEVFGIKYLGEKNSM